MYRRDLETTPGHILWEMQQVPSDRDHIRPPAAKALGFACEAHAEVAVLLSAPPPHNGVLLCLVRIGMCMYVCMCACMLFSDLQTDKYRRDLETTPGHLNPPGATITYGLQLQRLLVSYVLVCIM